MATLNEAKLENPQADSSERQVAVERDSTFSRAVADTGLVIDLGRDLEFSFLQFGPVVKARVRQGEDEDETEGYHLESAVTEVARIRMPGPSALVMAMMIVESLHKAGRIDSQKLVADLQDRLLKVDDDNLQSSEVSDD